MAGSGYTFTTATDATTGAFRKIEVSGQSTVEADQTHDTLTLAAVGPLAITTNASTDSVSISGSPHISKVHAGTSGYIPYYTASHEVSKAAQLYYDASNNRVGIGTTAPGKKLTVAGSISAQDDMFCETITVANNSYTFNNGAKFQTNSAGDIVLIPLAAAGGGNGSAIIFTSGGKMVTKPVSAAGSTTPADGTGEFSGNTSFTGFVSSTTVVYSSGGHSGQWETAYTDSQLNKTDITWIAASSATWDNTYNTVKSNSANWNQTGTTSTVRANSSSWTSGASDTFKTITLSAQAVGAAIGADVVADSSTDTLILSAGPHIALISDPSNETITISSHDAIGSGGGGGGGISFDGSTANGVLTYKDSDEATVEANFTFDGSEAILKGTLSARDALTTRVLNVSGDTRIVGDLTVLGDDIVMGTNTVGHILMGGGSNFGPVAQTSITSVGTISAGTWQGTAVADAYVSSANKWNWVASNSATNYSDTTTHGTISARDRIIASTGASLSGNVTIGGDLEVLGDDLKMGTNTVGHVLMGDGTNFGPVAQTSITSVGTISAGTWQGTAIGLGYGGTGLVGATDGKIVIADGSGAPVHLDVGSSTAITILGTIATGVWQGTAVADAYVAGSALWNWVASNSATKYEDTTVHGTVSARDRVIASVGASLSGDVTVGNDLTVIGNNLNINGVDYTWPSNNGDSGQTLHTDGSGTLSWADDDTGGGGGGGISFDGSTANGMLTRKDSDEATVEANYTFDGSEAILKGTLSARDALTTRILNVSGDTRIVGDLTVLGDDIVMGTNTVGHILMGSGTNFGPVAQTSITSLGTISAGTWQGTEVGLGYGGTGLVGATDGKIVIADGSGAPVHLDVGSSTGITILGTIATGVWQGTAVADAYVAGSALWNWVASNSATKYEDTSVHGTLSARDRLIASVGASLSGNVTIGGDLEVLGDDLKMGTNTVGHILMGDGTNFGPVAQTSITSVGTISAGTWQGTAIAQAYIAGDAINGDKIADDAIDSEHYTDGSIDTAHIADNQVTLAKMAGLTRGSIIYGDASGDPAALAKGTAGYVLKSDGTDIAYSNAILATDVSIGEDSQTKVDFGTANVIDFYADNANRMSVNSTAVQVLGPLSAGGILTAGNGTVGANISGDLVVADDLIVKGNNLTINGVTYTMPSDDGDAGEQLQTNGSGTLSWEAAGSGGGSGMTAFILEDGDGTEVSISNNEEIKFVEGGGIDIDWTDTDNGTDGDPFDLTFTINAAQTGITSLLATDIKIGEDDQTKIDFETNDEIHFYAANVHQVKLVDNAFTPQADSDVDLGATGTYWKDAYIDSITTTGNIGVGTTAPVAEVTVAGEVSARDGFSSSVKATTNLTSHGVVTYDMTGPALQQVVLKANQTNTYLGAETLPIGKTVTVKLSACGGDRTLSFHESMIFVGEKPASIATGKQALLTVTTFGTVCANAGKSDITCAYAVQD